MGTYNLPRNVKGEGRILYIFSTKALIYMLAGGLIGAPFYLLFDYILHLQLIGLIIVLIFAFIGFVIATVKVPETNAFEITRKTGSENLDDVLKRWVKFKFNKNRIYVYKPINEDITKEEEK